MEKKIHQSVFLLHQYVHIPGVSPSPEVIMFAGDRRINHHANRGLTKDRSSLSSEHLRQYLRFILHLPRDRGKVTESTSQSSRWPRRDFLAGKVYTRAIPTYGVQSDHSPHTGAPVSDSRYGRLPRSHVSVATHTISWSVTGACAGVTGTVKFWSNSPQLSVSWFTSRPRTPRILLQGIPTNIWSPFLGRFTAWRVSGRAGPPPPSQPASLAYTYNQWGLCLLTRAVRPHPV